MTAHQGEECADLLVSQTLEQNGELELARELIAREEFLSIVSHELKTPLTSMKLRLQLAKRQVEKGGKVLGPETLIEIFDASLRQVDRLANSIESLLSRKF